MNDRNEGKVVRFSLMWLFVFVIIVASLIAFFKNVIFATNQKDENEIKEIKIEANEEKVDLVQVMLDNTLSNRRLVNEEREIGFETVKEDASNLPLGEEKVVQEGVVGKKKVTALQEYQDDKLSTEKIIEEIVELEPITQKINVGTSQFLATYNVHFGNKMFLLEANDIKKDMSNDSETVYNIKRYLDVTLEDVIGEWAKVKYDTYEGYIMQNKLTSEAVTPKIKEKNRIATLQAGLNIDMDVGKVSGLTLSDYKTIFTNNASDKNNIFQNNAEVFYNMEQKYKINGVFLASIGIHESAWGTSKLATEKFNLFGFAAYDRDPYNSAATFTTYEECIETVAKALAQNYLNASGTKITEEVIATGSYCNGKTIPSVNIRYASDENWCNKVFSYMQYLYSKL